MNDRHDPYGQRAGQPPGPQIFGYDEYGRPLYHPPQPQFYDGDGYDYGTAGTGPQPQVHDGHGYGYDPAGTGQQPPVADGYDYSAAAGAGHRPTAYDTQGHPVYPPQPGASAVQGPGPGPGPYGGGDTGEQPFAAAPPAPPGSPGAPGPSGVPGQRRPQAGDAYQTEQFAFVDEADEDSEDVIDWLKFTESRTERREEAKRRGRVRRRLLVFTLFLALLGGTGYLWATDRLPAIPGLDSAQEETATAAEVRDVIVVHLRETDGDTTSTALLVANETTEQGTTLLLPNDLATTSDGTTTTLGEAVTESSAGAVREGLGSLLGADIKGTWRLDTPYLEILVDVLGGVAVDTNATVPAPAAGDGEGNGGEGGGKPLVRQGQNTSLDGRAAVAYAVHHAEGEPATAQLERFGQVMAAVLAKMPTGRDAAIEVVRALRQIADPSLPEEELGASLAQLAGYAQAGDAHDTTLLPVREDGTLSEQTADGMVRDVLGGTVTNADPGTAARIEIRDASGAEGTAENARIALVNGGFTVVGAQPADETRDASRITYREPAHRETALDTARTLGLPESAVTQGEGAGHADVTVVLGSDYEQ